MKKRCPPVYCACGELLEDCRCGPQSDASLFTAAELGLDPEEDDAYIQIQSERRGRCDV